VQVSDLIEVVTIATGRNHSHVLKRRYEEASDD
jgi:hypothetical protein